MAITVSVQYDGGLFSDIILLTQCISIGERNPFKCHEEVLYLQPFLLISPKRFDT